MKITFDEWKHILKNEREIMNDFETWLETQPIEIRNALRTAFQYGRLEGLEKATEILKGSLG